MRMTAIGLLCIAAAMASAQSAHANVRISEWMYSSSSDDGFEFIEITNTGAAPVDVTGWSFADSGRVVGAFSLSSLGTLAAGQAAIITEAFTAEDFHAVWGTPASLKIAAGNTTNLGRGDEMNIYDAGGLLVDQLTYGDVVFPGTIRTSGFSGNPSNQAGLGVNMPGQWKLSVVGDAFGSFASLLGDVGNPGVNQIPVPEPAAASLAAAGVVVLALRRRRA